MILMQVFCNTHSDFHMEKTALHLVYQIIFRIFFIIYQISFQILHLLNITCPMTGATLITSYFLQLLIKIESSSLPKRKQG